jgi:PKD repeat protein
MKKKTSIRSNSWINHLLLAFLLVFSVSSINQLNAQACTTPPTTLQNGNFDLPATALNLAGNNTSDNIELNNNLNAWFVSHGHPSTQTLPNRSMWMWSYGGYGEGIFNCFDFVQGQSYLICFDLQTNGKQNGATVNVKAANNLTASTSGNAIPSVPEEVIWSDLVANYSYNNWTQISVVYTPTSSYSSIWFHPFWSGAGGSGIPAPQGNSGQSEMRIDNVSITLLDPASSCPCDITANFTAVEGDSCNVQFTDGSSGNCCTNILGYQWDFGDGTTSNTQNPNHSYSMPGTYNVCLTTVGLNADGDCCTDEICYDVVVTCDSCECEVTADFEAIQEDCEVRFNDLSAGNECTSITGWDWDFGDGNGSGAQNPVHTYAGSGNYTVCLTVYATADDGTECSDEICYDISVECEDDCCPIEMDMAFDINGCEVEFFGFANSDCEIIDWDWDFGDGNTANGQNVSHTYGSNGIYNVCLTVTIKTPEGKICKETICIEIRIEDCDPDVVFGKRANSTSGSNRLSFEPRIYPNPSANVVNISFENTEAVNVEVMVYDGSMKKIATLTEGVQEAGTHELKWNSLEYNTSGGTYYIMIKQGNHMKLEKVLIQK